jgi:hypothetical protein
LGGPNRNRVLGGVLMHQTRASVNSSYCDEIKDGPLGGRLPGAKFADLATICNNRDFLRTVDGTGEYFEVWEQQMADPAQPYGSDPIWIRSSSLFRELLGGAEGNYYNMTPGSPELNENSGTMFTHFPRDVPGKPVGFPIFIETALDEMRLAETLVYTEDSNYMDQRSEVSGAFPSPSFSKCFCIFFELNKFAFVSSVFEFSPDWMSIADRPH